VIFIAFFGEAHTAVERRPGPAIRVPLVILAALSVVGGLVQTPNFLGRIDLFSRFISTALPPAPEASLAAGPEHTLAGLAMAAPLVGILLAYVWFLRRRDLMEALTRAGLGAALHRFWFAGWDFDRLYDATLVRPFLRLARLNRQDVVDAPYRGAAQLSLLSYRALARSQTGRLRWYAAVLATGSVVIVAIAWLL
jgi:NADH-quinone oxidoreductase subunit L